MQTINKDNAYKLVNKRLGFVFLLILFVIGLSSYYLEQHRLLKDVHELAVDRAKQYVMQFGDLLINQQAVDNGSVQKSIEKFSKSGVSFSEGLFVSVLIRDNRGKVAASFHNEKYATDETIKSLERDNNSATEVIVETIEMNSQELILLQLPIINRNGGLLGQSTILFLPAQERLQLIHKRIRETTLAAITIVLMMALVIYPIIILLVKQLTVLSTNLLIANLQTVQSLGNAIAKRDSDTNSHNYRVTIYSVRLAEVLGLDPEKMQGLIKGAFLHDVGKIGTPDNILLKPGKLTDVEFSEMKNHVRYGVEIINSSAWLKDAEYVVLHHHEKYNGTGYSIENKEALAGKAIPLVARVFAIADVFDALTSQRPYKKPISFETTMLEMEKNVDIHFDPELFVGFKTIAKPLYETIANSDDEFLQNELKEIVQKYFLQDMEQFLS